MQVRKKVKRKIKQIQYAKLFYKKIVNIDILPK